VNNIALRFAMNRHLKSGRMFLRTLLHIYKAMDSRNKHIGTLQIHSSRKYILLRYWRQTKGSNCNTNESKCTIPFLLDGILSQDVMVTITYFKKNMENASSVLSDVRIKQSRRSYLRNAPRICFSNTVTLLIVNSVEQSISNYETFWQTSWNTT
jgi:hypothetical protein